MTIAIDNQQRFGGGMNFDIPYSNTPQFTNPWTSATSATPHSLYAPNHQSVNPNINIDVKPQPRRLQSNVNLSYSGVHVNPSSSNNTLDTYTSHHLLNNPQELLNNNRTVSNGYDQSYSAAPSPIQHSFSQSQAPYDTLGYAQTPIRPSYAIQHQDNARRLSQTSIANENRNIHETIDSSRGIMAMSSNTAQNNYAHAARLRGSGEAYTFTGNMNHSSNSSISSSSPYPSFYGGSVDSNISEYTNSGLPSTNAEMDSIASRTLPRPPSILGVGVPPAPQTMMGQFSSKVSSSTQKKHKCKVCDKRFTRPSSLQTHMYSHTGEKPFICTMGGCGRQFSVVSNLRRHQKVHKNESRSEAGSEGHHSDE